jgi:hypothetical protein
VLEDAEDDLRYLLNRGYPQKGALNFVSGHYLLDQEERNYLARKVSSDQTAKKRRVKLLVFKDLKNQFILVDGYNVLITLESVLHHPETILKSDDGVLRDTKAVFGKYRPHRDTLSVLNTLMNFLKEAHPKELHFFYDSPVSRSGELAHLTRAVLRKHHLPGDATTSPYVDRELIKNRAKKVIATSDGPLMDKVERVVDLPGLINSKVDPEGFDQE